MTWALPPPLSFLAKLSFSKLPLWVIRILSVIYGILPFNTGLSRLLKFALSWLWLSPFYGSQPCVTPPSSICFPLLPLQGINFRFMAKGNNHFYKTTTKKNKQKTQTQTTEKAQKVWFSNLTNLVRTLEKGKGNLKPTLRLLSH